MAVSLQILLISPSTCLGGDQGLCIQDVQYSPDKLGEYDKV